MNQNRREFLKTMAAGPVAAVMAADAVKPALVTTWRPGIKIYIHTPSRLNWFTVNDPLTFVSDAGVWEWSEATNTVKRVS